MRWSEHVDHRYTELESIHAGRARASDPPACGSRNRRGPFRRTRSTTFRALAAKVSASMSSPGWSRSSSRRNDRSARQKPDVAFRRRTVSALFAEDVRPAALGVYRPRAPASRRCRLRQAASVVSGAGRLRAAGKGAYERPASSGVWVPRLWTRRALSRCVKCRLCLFMTVSELSVADVPDVSRLLRAFPLAGRSESRSTKAGLVTATPDRQARRGHSPAQSEGASGPALSSDDSLEPDALLGPDSCSSGSSSTTISAARPT